MRRKKQVGIRQLRQNLSVYLRKVVSGETLEVTDRGRSVAVLAPLAETSTTMERLIASGRATAPRGDVLKLGPPRSRQASTRASRALRELREERL
ncbi:MAG: type II toxin-antitoxin system Phd/YefM family antitoxin [Acidobacteriota bacterium]